MDRIELSDGVVRLRPPTFDDIDTSTEACQDPEISAWVAPWARRQGHLQRAVDLILDHAFAPGGLDLLRVGWQAYVGNWPSRRVAWRAGFRIEGTVRLHAVQREGLRRDAWLGTLLRGDPREPNEPWPDDAPG